jgi:hypothetical protein
VENAVRDGIPIEETHTADVIIEGNLIRNEGTRNQNYGIRVRDGVVNTLICSERVPRDRFRGHRECGKGNGGRDPNHKCDDPQIGTRFDGEGFFPTADGGASSNLGQPAGLDERLFV